MSVVDGVSLRRLTGLFLLLAAAMGAPLAAAPLQVDQVAPGVYVHIGQHKDFEDGYDGDIANIGFIIGTDAVAVIDTGGSYAVGMALNDALRAITQLPVRYVINTHGHPDHVFGNAAFLHADGAGVQPQMIGHARLPRALAARGDAYLRNLARQLREGAKNSVLIAPGQTVQDRLTLDLGQRKLELRAWPGAHTDNDLTVFDDATGTLFSGDLLFIERTPAIDGDVKGWLTATQQLKQLPAGVVVPGHGPVTRDKTEVILIGQRADFISCPVSNRVLGAQRTLEQITFGYDALARHHGVKRMTGSVTAIDTDKSRIVWPANPCRMTA